MPPIARAWLFGYRLLYCIWTSVGVPYAQGIWRCRVSKFFVRRKRNGKTAEEKKCCHVNSPYLRRWHRNFLVCAASVGVPIEHAGQQESRQEKGKKIKQGPFFQKTPNYSGKPAWLFQARGFLFFSKPQQVNLDTACPSSCTILLKEILRSPYSLKSTPKTHWQNVCILMDG